MKTIAKKVLPVVLAGATLAGCVSDMGTKQTGGAVLGGVAGGLLGSQIGSGRGQMAAVAAGTLLGALAGSEVGKSLDRADRQYLQQAEYSAYSAPVGQRIQWNNPQSGNYGYITPTRDGRDSMTGAHCREFQQTIVVGGQTQSGYGTACQQPDGSWRIVQ
jgi:surface antigen